MEKKNEEILLKYGASTVKIGEMLKYNENIFQAFSNNENVEDEEFIEVWNLYKKEAELYGAYFTLSKYIPQLHFAIREGVSQSNEYRDVTLRGKPILDICNMDEFELAEPDELELDIYSTHEGHIPILFTPINSDFEKLVRALAGRNEPIEIPDTMGAYMVSSYNNWERIRRDNVKCTKANKEIYQDRFIILSNNFYRGITPEQVGMNEKEWRKVSFIMHRARECMHYVTLRLFGSMQNEVQDEIVADFFAMLEAVGEYKPVWALLFLGLENDRGNPPLSESSFHISNKKALDAVINLTSLYLNNKESLHSEQGKIDFLKKLKSSSLEEIAKGFSII